MEQKPKDKRKLCEAMVSRQWKPGQSGNPKGKPKGAYCAATLFKRALERFQEENRTDIFELFLKRAAKSDQVLVSALNKLLPNKQQIGIGSEDINYIIEAVSDILIRHVKDPETLRAICADLQKLELQQQL